MVKTCKICGHEALPHHIEQYHKTLSEYNDTSAYEAKTRAELRKEIKKREQFINIASQENPMNMGPEMDRLEALRNELASLGEGGPGSGPQKGGGSISSSNLSSIKQDAMANQDLYGSYNFDPSVHMDGGIYSKLQSDGVSDDEIISYVEGLKLDVNKRGDFMKSEYGESVASEAAGGYCNKCGIYSYSSMTSHMQDRHPEVPRSYWKTLEYFGSTTNGDDKFVGDDIAQKYYDNTGELEMAMGWGQKDDGWSNDFDKSPATHDSKYYSITQGLYEAYVKANEFNIGPEMICPICHKEIDVGNDESFYHDSSFYDSGSVPFGYKMENHIEQEHTPQEMGVEPWKYENGGGPENGWMGNNLYDAFHDNFPEYNQDSAIAMANGARDYGDLMKSDGTYVKDPWLEKEGFYNESKSNEVGIYQDGMPAAEWWVRASVTDQENTLQKYGLGLDSVGKNWHDVDYKLRQAMYDDEQFENFAWDFDNKGNDWDKTPSPAPDSISDRTGLWESKANESRNPTICPHCGSDSIGFTMDGDEYNFEDVGSDGKVKCDNCDGKSTPKELTGEAYASEDVKEDILNFIKIQGEMPAYPSMLSGLGIDISGAELTKYIQELKAEGRIDTDFQNRTSQNYPEERSPWAQGGGHGYDSGEWTWKSAESVANEYGYDDVMDSIDKNKGSDRYNALRSTVDNFTPEQRKEFVKRSFSLHGDSNGFTEMETLRSLGFTDDEMLGESLATEIFGFSGSQVDDASLKYNTGSIDGRKEIIDLAGLYSDGLYDDNSAQGWPQLTHEQKKRIIQAYIDKGEISDGQTEWNQSSHSYESHECPDCGDKFDDDAEFDDHNERHEDE